MNKQGRFKSVILILTGNCNLRCSYCYEVNKNNHRMSLDTCLKILNDELTADDGTEEVEISVFGGEPFLEFENIKKIANYLQSKSFPKKYTMFATTNGTLVHGEVQSWLREHKELMTCSLSLDGTPKMHNINRDNSFSKIDLDFFLELYPDQTIKMTVSKETLPDLAEGIIYCHEKGFEISCNLAYGIDWTNEGCTTILEEQLKKLIDYYINNPNIKPCTMLGARFESIGYDNGVSNEYCQRWCGAGQHIHTYDTDGQRYPCQLFLPISAGDEKAQKSKEITFIDKVPLTLLDEECRMCIVRDLCPTCYGTNYIQYGNIYKKDPNVCLYNKIIMKARAYFRAKQYELGLLNDWSEEELQALFRSIIKINDLK